MSREELLAWVGIVIGVPSFLLLFVTGFLVLGILVTIVVGVLVWFKYSLDQPEFTLLLVEKTLTFRDRDSHVAEFVRTQKARANHKGLREFWVGNISADGQIDNIRVDNKLPDQQDKDAGDIRICKRFSRALKRGQVVNTKLSYDLQDSFTNNPDRLLHTVAHKTKILRMRINFHPDKPCAGARVHIRYGSQIYKELPAPTISADKLELSLERKNPKLGEEYSLEWDW